MFKNVDRRAALTTLAAGAAALPTIAAASQAARDPILEIIEAHRAAWSRSEAALQAYHADPSSETDACHEASSHAIDQTRDALRDTRPTTVAGAAALAAYIFTEMQNTAFDQDDRDLLEALADGLKLLCEKQS